MDPRTAIVLNTFPDASAADMAASQLRSCGIECLITTDDCGGMVPPLGVIKLLVASADARDAREILQLAPADTEPANDDRNQLADSTIHNGRPSRVYRFSSGLVIGLIVGALLHFSYTSFQQHRYGTFENDNDGDGLSDEQVVWRNGQYVEARFDQNADGRPDYWIHYQKSVPTHDEADDNFDGKVDVWHTYSAKGFISAAKLDTDFNGISDVAMTYEHGLPKQADWRPNGTTVIVLRQLYRHGVLREELRDVNGDGRFDVSVIYDAFNTAISTNHLQSFLRSLP